MKYCSMLMISTLALVLSACGGGGGEPTGANAVVPPSSGTTTDTGNTTDTASNSAGSQGDNPGTVPGPVIAELSSLDVSTNDTPRGTKVFFGPAVDPVASAIIQERYADSYINVTFNCLGRPNMEWFPSAALTNIDPAFTAVLGWDPEDLAVGRNSLEFIIADTTSGGEDHDGYNFEGRITDNTIIVGTSSFYDLVAARIVQFEDCNS